MLHHFNLYIYTSKGFIKFWTTYISVVSPRRRLWTAEKCKTEYHICIILHALRVPVFGFLVMRRRNFTVSLNVLFLISCIFCNKNYCPKQNFAASRSWQYKATRMRRRNFTVSLNVLFLISCIFCNKNYCPKQNFATSRSWQYKATRNCTCFRSTYLRSCVWALLWSAETSNTDRTLSPKPIDTNCNKHGPSVPTGNNGQVLLWRNEWLRLFISICLLQNYVLWITTRWKMITGNRATTFAAGLVPWCITLVLVNKSKYAPYNRLYLSCSIVELLVKHGASFQAGNDTVFCGSTVEPSIRRNKRP